MERGNVLQALAAAHELGRLTLQDSLALTAMLARENRNRFSRAAPRWFARFVLEVKDLDVDEAALALSAVKALGGEAARSGA